MFPFPRILLKHWSQTWLFSFLLSFFFISSILFLFTISEDIQKYIDLCFSAPFAFLDETIFAYLTWTTPICCFTGTILTFFTFEKNLEWSSLKACSISPHWVTGTILLLSALISVIAVSYTIFKSDASALTFRADKVGFTMKVGERSSWFFQSFNRILKEGKNLQVYFYDDKGNDALRIRCEEASWHRGGRWIFRNGVYLSFQTEKGLPIPHPKENKIQWKEVEQEPFYKKVSTGNTPLRKVMFSELSICELNENPEFHILLSENPENLSFQKLQEIMQSTSDGNPREIAPFRYQYAKIWVSFFSCLFATLVALGLVARLERKSLPKIFSIILCGMVIFYVITRISKPLGEAGIMNGWISAVFPYFSILVFMLITQTQLPSRKSLRVQQP